MTANAVSTMVPHAKTESLVLSFPHFLHLKTLLILCPAYVNTLIPKVVNLCGAFWRAQDSGTDSKAGTIVHEASHFPGNGGTKDHAYGHTLAHNLALTDPDRAIFNADSHEYFAENTPFDE
jgi:hypothetical protein